MLFFLVSGSIVLFFWGEKKKEQKTPKPDPQVSPLPEIPSEDKEEQHYTQWQNNTSTARATEPSACLAASSRSRISTASPDEGELAAHRATPAHLREGSKFCCGVKFREPHLLRKHRETSAHATHKDGFKTEAKAWSAYHSANRAYWTKKP